MKAVRIFVSSPGDVGRERETAAKLIARLRAEYAGRADVEGYFWEHEPMHAGSDFQAQIPPPANFDVFVGILWSRLGSRLHAEHVRTDGTRYSSGTEFEFENALEAYRKSANKTPRLLIYRRSELPSFPAEPLELRQEREKQWDALKGFIDRWFVDVTDGGTFKAAFNLYSNTADFEDRLENHLRKIIAELIGEEGGRAKDEAQPLPPAWKAGSPYRGLKVFEYEHASIFFGRTQEIDRVIGQLRVRANDQQPLPFVLIFGSSGSGKSSLLRAGVIPLLSAGGVDGIGLWRRAMMQPSQSTGDLFDGLAAALLEPAALPELSTGGKTGAKIASMLRENAAGVGLLIAGLLPQIAQRQHDAEKSKLQTQADECLRDGRPADAEYLQQLLKELRYPEPRLLLGLDQVEEVFTHDDRFPMQNRHDFISAIESLVRGGFVWVVATLRSDFFARCEEIPNLVRLKEGLGQFHLLPPTATALAHIIRLPAQAAGVRFEDHPVLGRLDDVLRDEAVNDLGSLPLLEFALDQLFAIGSADRLLSHAEYKQLGGGKNKGLRGVFVTTADQAYERLSQRGRDSLPQVFVRLATLNAGEDRATDGHVRFSRRTDIRADNEVGAGEREVVEKFLEARLFVSDSDANGRQLVAVAHEAILNEWPRVRELLEAETGHLRSRARLAAAATEWEREGKNSDRLATGVLLAEALEVKKREEGHLAPNESEYIKLSQRASRRRTIHALSVAAVLVVIFAVLAGGAILAARAASARKRETQRILTLSDLTRAEGLSENGDAATALAVLARAAESDSKEGSVAGDRLWFALTQRMWAVPISVTMQHKAAITTACFKPDGTRVLTASEDRTAQIWDPQTGRAVGPPMQNQTAVRLAIFSPNGSRILTTCFDGHAHLWDAMSSQEIPNWLIGHENSIESAAFSSNGRWIATGSRDGVVRLWDSANGQRISELREADNVHTLSFHPSDNSLLLTASVNSARLYKMPEGKQLFELAHAAQINAECFSPDGALIGTASSDGTARLCNTSTGDVVAELKHDSAVRNICFSRDSRFVATCEGALVRLWTSSGQPLLDHPIQHDEPVVSLRFSPDGLRLLTGSASGKAQMWSTLTGEALAEPIRSDAPLVSAIFSPDGTSVLTVTNEGAARVWKTPAFHPVSNKVSTTGSIASLTISPNGQFLLAGCSDGKIVVYDVATSPLKTRLLQYGAAVVCAAFSPDGKTIASGGADRRVHLWRADSVETGTVSPDTHATVSSLAFSSDGKFLATGSDVGIAQLWELPALRPTGVALVHKARITSVVFARNNKVLLTASADGTARTWNVPSGKGPAIEIKAEKEITCAAFSPDDNVIATASREGIAQLWSTSSGQKIHDPLQHKGPVVNLSFSFDGQRLVTASEDGTAAIWDVKTGRSVCDSLGHAFGVTQAIFSPDARRIATASEDGTARLWDASTGQPLSELMRHKKSVQHVVFSRDGRTLFTASDDHTVRMWDVDSATELSERQQLANFARALSSTQLQDSGRLEPRVIAPASSLQTLATGAQGKKISALFNWFFADPMTRPLSPNTRTTVPEYINARIEEAMPTGLEEAALLAEGAPETLKQIAAKESAKSTP